MNYSLHTVQWIELFSEGEFVFLGTEFVVPFSSRSRSLALKSSRKIHQMASFFIQKEVLGEKIIV